MNLVKHTENGVTSIYLLTDTGDILTVPLVEDPMYSSNVINARISHLTITGLNRNMIPVPEVSDLELKELQSQMKKKKIEGDFEDATQKT